MSFLCVSLCRLLFTLRTTVRPARSAAIDARPTCVPTCSLLMEVAATSVVSATVSMKVRTGQCNQSYVILNMWGSLKKTHHANFWNQKRVFFNWIKRTRKLWIYCAQFYIQFYFFGLPQCQSSISNILTTWAAGWTSTRGLSCPWGPMSLQPPWSTARCRTTTKYNTIQYTLCRVGRVDQQRQALEFSDCLLV